MLKLSPLEALKTPSHFLSELLSSIDHSEDRFTDSEQIRIASIRGIVSYRNDNFSDAEGYFTKAIDASPNDSVLLWLRALCRSATNEYAAAENDCKRSIALDGRFIPPRLTLVALYLKASQLTSASTALLETEEIDAKSEASYLNYFKAVLAFKQKDWEATKDFANLALTSLSTYQVVPAKALWQMRMRAGLAKKDGSEVILASERVIAESPDDTEALFALWKALRIEGKMIYAQGVSEKLYTVNPNDEKHVACRMVSMGDVGQINAAEMIAEDMLKKNPQGKLPLEILQKIRMAKNNMSDDSSLSR
ncbi:MAG: hypothetical protein SGI77_08920 [Pirellulaceae bacterium]|nr:hypothetical protein [Pirellulaceae bacterium]